MPAKTKASASTAAAAAAPAPEASTPKPKTTRRRAAPKRKAASTAAAKKSSTPRKRKKAAAPERSKAAVAKLQSAIDQLEEALQASEAGAERMPTPPMSPPPAAVEPEPKLPMPRKAAPAAPAVEIPGDGWKRAAGPALATCAVLIFVGTLIVGYSTGYAVGNGSGQEPMVTVASASERVVEPAAVAESVPPAPTASASVEAAVEKPSPTRTASVAPSAEKPAPTRTAAPVAARSEPAGGLHLQVSALKSRQAAAKLGERLEKDGFPVQVREPEADGLVRVLVGPVDDSDQLTAMANRLREEGLKPFPKRL